VRKNRIGKIYIFPDVISITTHYVKSHREKEKKQAPLLISCYDPEYLYWMENSNTSKLLTMVCMIDGKVDSIMDAVAQIISKQENKEFKDVIESMSKRASEYAAIAIEVISKKTDSKDSD